MTIPPDRKFQPSVFPFNARINVPVEERILNNGASLFLMESGTEDIMRMEFVFRAGMIQEHLPLLATSVNMMLTEGTEKYSSEELNTILDYYGIFINQVAEKDNAGLTVYFLNRHLEKVLGIVREILFHPVFPEKELRTLINKRLSWFRINKEKVHHLASEQFFESLFGSHHPYGRQVLERDFGEINSALLRDFHTRFYIPEKMAVIISGRIHEDTVNMFQKYFGELRSQGNYIEDFVGQINGDSTRKKHINKKGALQTALRIGSTAINKRHPDYPGLKILNVVLGGYFGSRLMKNLREDKGYTYGIQSTVSSLDLCGFKVISTEVGKAYTDLAADEIYREVLRLQSEPVPDEEMKVVRQYMSGEMVRMFDGPFAIAESFKAAWEFGLDFSYFKDLMEKVMTITPDEITELARKYYKIEDLYEITAGER